MGLVINIANSISGLPEGYQQAIGAAIDFFESTITTNITVNLSFDWSALGAGELADNDSKYYGFTYAQVYGALQSVDGASAASSVQQAAAETLQANFPTDPTDGGQFLLTAAEADELGLNTTPIASDATITLNSSDAYTWSQSGGIAAGTFDAVGAIEHEISEALGRTAFLGALSRNQLGTPGGALPSYNILDLFHYSAAGGAGSAASGAAAGALDEPFVAGYDASVQGYFSYDGATVTLPFASPTEIAAGADVGDWSSAVVGDAFGYAKAGTLDAVSATDLQELNVIGYSETSAPCFCAGTAIATTRGEVAVEGLTIGDRVVLARGGLRAIVWIGRRALDTTRHRAPRDVWPVRVAAHAFGAGLPRRDLWLSPGHNIALEGVLMPIAALINGRSIVQVSREKVEYWHVELDAHDILLAEGLPAESYLDCGNRRHFANGGAFVEAHPDFQPKHWAETCLPLVAHGPEVAKAKSRLIERLLQNGHALTRDAAPHILADGERIEPIWLSTARLAFVLPAGATSVLLRSKTFVPAHTIAANDDERELGICVERLQIDGENFALADAGTLGSGWRDPESGDGRPAWRWTTGAAALRAGARVVIVDLGGHGTYWREPNGSAAAVGVANGPGQSTD